MRCVGRFRLAAMAPLLVFGTTAAQEKAPVKAQPGPVAVASRPAAVVNGQEISEMAVQRALKRVPPAKQADARPEILNFLIDNALIDQYLTKIPLAIDPVEVETKLKQVKDEIQKEGSTFEKLMGELMLTEGELREQIASQLRWDKFANAQANEKALRELFESNRDMFDGSQVHARHILMTPPAGDAKASEQMKRKLADFKTQMEAQTAKELAKLPPQTDNLEREKLKAKVLVEAFGALAAKESACPSQAQGGDLGWFPRAGNMVEPFAKAAFELKPFQLSDVVTTQFGYHLILVTERKAGRDVKFEDIKDEVKDIYFDRLREMMIARLRPVAKITVNPVTMKP